MVSVPNEKILFSEIQKRLMYLVPEKWEVLLPM